MAAWRLIGAGEPGWAGLEALPGGTIFHSARWARVIESGLGGPVRVVAKVDDAGRVVAGWPAALLRFGPVRMLYGTFPKGNFAGPAEAVTGDLPAMEDACRAAGVHCVRLIACEGDPVRDLPGARRAQHVRHVLDLGGRTVEQVWDGYKQRVRRDVRVARKAGVSVRPMRGDDLPAFHSMMGEVQQRNAAATAIGPKFYDALWSDLAADGTAEFLIAELAGRPLAAAVGIHDRGVTYYLAACSRTGALRLCPNDLLAQGLIESAVRRAARRFDFLSSDAGDKGLIAFKAKWGAEERPFDLVERWFSPWRRRLWDAALAAAHQRTGAAVVRWLRRRRGR